MECTQNETKLWYRNIWANHFSVWPLLKVKQGENGEVYYRCDWVFGAGVLVYCTQF